ncbi:CU044_5270 family protein [Streptomyces yaanensis]|uniref:CU044_5270 family protein n=1 Tax=Streptomyces yaanensis TaxID=1142239 RepID=A0ABV7SJ87_9ACTN|nr:CU044_5270 family protein [Streptomyces sp. CGMCC 4.7035]WNB97024.1 CU044_5270 family protein [Streptomyces sp. CGMCC 4.7035]
MNTNNPPSTGTGRSEAEELLSAPAEWDLPLSRHLHYKDVLMQQIDNDRTASAASAQESPAPRRRFSRRMVLVPVASMALAGALAVTFSAGDHHTSTPATGSSTQAAKANGASVTLDRIAAVAMKTDATPVRDDQFVYVRSLVQSNEGAFDGPVRLSAPYKREFWRSQKPGPVATTGWIRETGKGAVMSGQLVPVEGEAVPAGIDHPTYKWLASLPTDPDALLKLLYAQVRVEEGRSKDQAVFSEIGNLLGETIMPPANAAAFYKAAGKIPCVTEIPDAVDAAGRHGIAITRRDAASATRDEWIFDKKSLAFLGSRSYITKDKAKGITSDTLYGSDAILQRTVVDEHGKAPATKTNS